MLFIRGKQGETFDMCVCAGWLSPLATLILQRAKRCQSACAHRVTFSFGARVFGALLPTKPDWNRSVVINRTLRILTVATHLCQRLIMQIAHRPRAKLICHCLQLSSVTLSHFPKLPSHAHLWLASWQWWWGWRGGANEVVVLLGPMLTMAQRHSLDRWLLLSALSLSFPSP